MKPRPGPAGPWLPRNCAAITESLAEGELFGSVRGAFTGALDRPGVFEAAKDGTVFLDEVGELSPALQPKLLRVIQEKKVLRVGDRSERPVNFRLIAATLRDLGTKIRDGSFREDLYFRLSVFIIRVPALRERLEDIPYLVRHLLSGSAMVELTSAALERLQQHTWPGNVRELQHVLTRANAFRRGPRIDVEDLRFESTSAPQKANPARRFVSLRDEEVRRQTEAAWEASGRRNNEAARLLGISPGAMTNRRRKLGLT